MKTFTGSLLVLVLAISATALAQNERRRRAGRGQDKAPALGAAIPNVSAKSPDGKTTVDFAKPKRHTVLIFGSHT